MTFRVFIPFVLNLSYLIETFSDLIFKHGHIQRLAYNMSENSCICLSETLPGCLQHTALSSLFSALPLHPVVVPIIALINFILIIHLLICLLHWTMCSWRKRALSHCWMLWCLAWCLEHRRKSAAISWDNELMKTCFSWNKQISGFSFDWF